MTEDDFNKSITHGIMAVTPDGRVLHFVGFMSEPNPGEYIALQEELETDFEFKISVSASPHQFISGGRDLLPSAIKSQVQ